MRSRQSACQDLALAPLCRKKNASSAYSRIVVCMSTRSSRSVEFLKVALPAHRAHTRRRWTADATSTAATCSREQNSSSRIPPAKRSPGLQRRLRALHGVAECSRYRASIEAQRWPERSAASRGALWSTYDRPKLIVAGLAARRLTLWSCWAPHVQKLQVSRCGGGVGMLKTGMCKKTRCFKVRV